MKPFIFKMSHWFEKRQTYYWWSLNQQLFMEPNLLNTQSRTTYISDLAIFFFLDIARKLCLCISFLLDVGRPIHQKLNTSHGSKSFALFNVLSHLTKERFFFPPPSVRLFTCNISMPIKGYLSNYNGAIKATRWRGDSVPDHPPHHRGKRKCSSPGLPGARSSPLNSNPRALYQHLIPVSICLKMAANAGSMFQYWKRFDLQQLQVSLTFCSSRVASVRRGRLASLGPPRWSPFGGRRVGCFGGEEFETSSSHWWKWLSRWSEIDPLCSIQHRSDTATGRAGATPRGCAEIKPKIADLRRWAFVRQPLLRVPQLLVERVAVVSPTLSRCKVGSFGGRKKNKCDSLYGGAVVTPTVETASFRQTTVLRLYVFPPCLLSEWEVCGSIFNANGNISNLIG